MRAGRRPVMELFKAGVPVNRVWMARDSHDGSIGEIRRLAREAGVPVLEVDRSKLDAMAEGINHQGVVASVLPRAYVEVDDLLSLAAERGEAPWLVALDGLEDPQNLGAILRTVEAVGAHGVIITKRRSVQVAGGVVKASAGAVDLVPVARVSNLVQTLEYLKQKGCWVVGLAPEGQSLYHQSDLTGGLVLVIGGEGKGLSQLTLRTCDYLAALPMRGQIGSLNASVAAGVILYEALRQRMGKNS
ncbi:MAG: 23S rRNA (guanosine(2251)-2'-O)-methyltransferase RlmB [Firmicutes bacterium]|nr:23S rRNA (guanosine(2251)-2'-O)-methyltransferase RlmB [Bacillota bacterium]